VLLIELNEYFTTNYQFDIYRKRDLSRLLNYIPNLI